MRWLLDVLHLACPPNPVSSGRDRARVVSLRRELFSFFWHFFPNVFSYVLKHINLSNCHLRTYVGEQIGCCPFDLDVRGSNQVHHFFCVCDISLFLFQCKNTYDHRWWLRCRLRNREVIFICIHSAADAAAAALCVVLLLLLFLFSHADTTCGFTTEYLDLIDYTSKQLLHCTLLHDVRVCIRIYLPACCCVVCCYTADAAAAATCCCCSSSCAGWQNLLLWFAASDSSVLFLFIQTPFIFNIPLVVLSHLQRRFLLINIVT